MAKRRILPAANTAQSTSPKVYGYCRVSTDMQRESGISLEEQRRKIEGRCLEQGWQLAEVYVDAAVSGSTPLAKRPQGARLLAALNPGDIVIAAKMDRAFRSTLDALQTIQSFRSRKISLWLLDLGGDVSGNGIAELIMTVLAATAQFERSLISERITAAKAQMRHQGLLQGGKAPFGFKLGELAGRGRTRHLLPDPAQQEAIVTMSRMREEGTTLMEIRDTLRAQGFKISHQSVANILDRAETAA